MTCRPVCPHNATCYKSHGCRCDRCREAKREEMRDRRAYMHYDDVPKHGTANGYVNYGCRCQPCREANTKQQRKSRTTTMPKPARSKGVTINQTNQKLYE